MTDYPALRSWLGAFGAVTWLDWSDPQPSLAPQRVGVPQASASASYSDDP